MVTSSITAPSEPPPAPRLIARWMTSFETDCLRAASTATSSRGLCAGSGMPDFAATVISRTSLVVMEARLLAVISFLAWIHWRPMACACAFLGTPLGRTARDGSPRTARLASGSATLWGFLSAKARGTAAPLTRTRDERCRGSGLEACSPASIRATVAAGRRSDTLLGKRPRELLI